MEHLEMSLQYRDWIIGVGLDSDEKDNPPEKFQAVFRRARKAGYKLSMHCDVNQENIVEHLWQCLNTIEVDRIDHGVNALEDENLCREIARRQLGLTICPVSNRFVVQSLTCNEIRAMLQRGMKPSIHSDDPGYFRAYLTDNFLALVEDTDFSREEIATLNRNTFETSWLSDAEKARYLERVDGFS